ncbi:hypothetical protein [Spongiimicrobium sp. 3-5]|uniref:hypothetical protein n=1 Tax=Spongiimicrobium sp. 3-5 TaxID=3332596 RepID=UPI00397ED5F7
MRKIYQIALLMASLTLTQCQEKDTTFLVTKDRVGKLERSSVLKDLDAIYALDSIVKDTTKIRLGSSTKKVRIYEKGGKHLLTLTPSTDSLPVIENIRVYDQRFVTDKGVGLNSTFKDIKDNYSVRKVVTSLNNVVIFLKENDMYFTIDKQELPASLRYASSTNIEAVQIPDAARIKYLMIGWD